MKVITNIIEENGEIYEQVDSYNNETGEVSIEVPPHGDREPLKIMMDPIGVSSIRFDYLAFCLQSLISGHPSGQNVIQVPNQKYTGWSKSSQFGKFWR